jgi:hypothetical protein
MMSLELARAEDGAPHPPVSITAKLKQAGAALREAWVIRAEIARHEEVLRRLRKEHMRACSRERMAKMRQDPDFLRKRAEGSARAAKDPALIAKRIEIMRRIGQPLLLPPMTAEQKRRYGYLRYQCKLARDVALKEVGAV